MKESENNDERNGGEPEDGRGLFARAEFLSTTDTVRRPLHRDGAEPDRGMLVVVQERSGLDRGAGITSLRDSTAQFGKLGLCRKQA